METAALSSSPNSRRLHVATIVTICFTFPLIFLGGLVTSKHAGMSVPDWPNSYGYNMFRFPPKLWIGGIFYEHTHRLLGSVVGFCAVVMTLLAWGPGGSASRGKNLFTLLAVLSVANVLGTLSMFVWPNVFHLPEASRSFGNIASQGLGGEVGIALCVAIGWFCRSPEPRRGVRWLATACLIAIICQGILGGMRVDLVNLSLAIVHGCFAQATFCLLILTAMVTGRWWQNAARSPSSNDPGLTRLAVGAVAVVYCQLIVGALMRHFGAGLAIPDLPLAYGHLLPPMTDSALVAANHDRIWQYHLEPVSMGQVWLHFGHRIGAIVVTITLLILAGRVFSRHRNQPALVRPTVTLLVLLVTQIALGLFTVYLKKPADVASTHVAVGASVLATTFFIAVRSFRLYSMTTAQRSSRVKIAGHWPAVAELVR